MNTEKYFEESAAIMIAAKKEEFEKFCQKEEITPTRFKTGDFEKNLPAVNRCVPILMSPKGRNSGR